MGSLLREVFLRLAASYPNTALSVMVMEGMRRLYLTRKRELSMVLNIVEACLTFAHQKVKKN